MKIAIIILTWIGLVYGGYCIDSWIFNLIVNELPDSDWAGLIKIIIGVVLFFISGGFILAISTIITSEIAQLIKIN